MANQPIITKFLYTTQNLMCSNLMLSIANTDSASISNIKGKFSVKPKVAKHTKYFP